MSNPGFEYDTISSYAINFQCTDSNGETSATQTLTINILPNTPPTISGLPTSVTVNDGEDGPLKIYDVSVTDVESDSFSCSLSPTGTPFNYQSSPGMLALQFSLKHKSIPKSCWLSSLIPFPYLFTSMLYFCTSSFSVLFLCIYFAYLFLFLFSGHAIFVNSAPGLDATTTPSYALKITCADNYGASQGTLTVNVVANAAPDITNLPASTTVQESAAGGSSIFTVTVADPDSDTFSCTMSSSPTSTAFSLLHTTSR